MQSEITESRLARVLRSPTTLFSVVLGVWLLWLLIDIVIYFSQGAEALAPGGQFGDWFGGVNALFTALAFAAVTWSAFMQREEMRNQQTEMRNQQQEMRAQQQTLELQRQEMERARDISRRQLFESTYFQMLDQCRRANDNLQCAQGRSGILRGQQAMRMFANSCSNVIEFAQDIEDVGECSSAMGDSFETDVYEHHASSLGPYFRTLYHLFKFVDAQTHLSEAERRSYANIARAQLSADDLLVMALNACSDAGSGMRPYIERFGLLKHLELRNYDHLQTMRRCFAASAFQGFEESQRERYVSYEGSCSVTLAKDSQDLTNLQELRSVLDSIAERRSEATVSSSTLASEQSRVLREQVLPCLMGVKVLLLERGHFADVWQSIGGKQLRLMVKRSTSDDVSTASVLLIGPSDHSNMLSIEMMFSGNGSRVEVSESALELFDSGFVTRVVRRFIEGALG